MSNQKKIRDVERLMKRVGETPELLERLAVLKEIKQTSLQQLTAKKHSIQYHKVRFLERKKVTRALCSLDKKISAHSRAPGDDHSDVDDKSQASHNSTSSTINKEMLPILQQIREQLIDDLTYIMYYPMENKYVSLYANVEPESTTNNNDNEAKLLTTTLAKIRTATEKRAMNATEQAFDLMVRLSAREARDSDRKNEALLGRPDKVTHAITVARAQTHKKSKQKRLRRAAAASGDTAESNDAVDNVSGTATKKDLKTKTSKATAADAATSLKTVTTAKLSKQATTTPAAIADSRFQVSAQQREFSKQVEQALFDNGTDSDNSDDDDDADDDNSHSSHTDEELEDGKDLRDTAPAASVNKKRSFDATDVNNHSNSDNTNNANNNDSSHSDEATSKPAKKNKANDLQSDSFFVEECDDDNDNSNNNNNNEDNNDIDNVDVTPIDSHANNIYYQQRNHHNQQHQHNGNFRNDNRTDNFNSTGKLRYGPQTRIKGRPVARASKNAAAGGTTGKPYNARGGPIAARYGNNHYSNSNNRGSSSSNFRAPVTRTTSAPTYNNKIISSSMNNNNITGASASTSNTVSRKQPPQHIGKAKTAPTVADAAQTKRVHVHFD